MQSGTGPTETPHRGFQLGERTRGALMLAAAIVIMVSFAVAVMSYLTSPDGWVMQAAKQAIMEQQQAVHTIHLINATQ